jgi:hypothetical protein
LRRAAICRSNTYQGSDVKRTDGCITGAGWPSVEQTVKRHCQALAADLISVAGHSWWAAPNTYRGSMFRWRMFHGKQWHSQIPRPRNTSVPSSRSSQSSGLCRETLLVSSRLGGGAATGHLVTNHQGDERERQSNHCLRLGAFCPDVPAQSVLYIRKTHHEGSAHWWPVRQRALALPSGVTRSQSAEDQTRVPA